MLKIGFQTQNYQDLNTQNLFIKKQQSTQDNQIICENRIRLLNNSWITKISSKLASFKLFQEYQPIKNILDNLNEQTSNMFEFSEKQLISPKLCATLEQKDLCYAIVFDPQGKIMVSGCGNKIIIWNFENGQIQEVNSLLEHQKEITCLVYSQISNYFISGSSDGSIRLWNSENNNQWYSSRPYYEHNEWIYCMIITQNEDQLISSSADFTIKIWSIDFINYELTFLYSLSYHTSDVNSLSLNESEKVLVSCGYDSLIIIWQKGVKNQWSFQQIVNQSTQENGYHVRFLKEDQFIWLPSKSNMLCVYQNNNGKFEEIVDKRVLFKKDNQGCVNLPFFPIIFMKNKNLICLRHSLHILLLKELNNGYISIVQELYCQDWSTYGAVTNNGQYLIYWGENKKKYDIYELQYQ
ncbi:unnamed protein product (macronuclear) [Paramecium tetraurelia]|uniref:Uncharacterized protein n=1 Tax=Paramecium tetraurelia TaxID=5888 RepID=A0DAZ9_PARTE|nr:uncharacterized protein GSPATT00039373001 [Paramecium tetraurelia]CAK80216.1 unnamed protein product [Paramecium tetraurelia]|eukprot:XP_001447613.1 hypothetical protein (macronuclear) [Paramecium tetraurelia strain d4-2]